MRVLCTFPGRYGDLLWALPTVRALSRRFGTPVELMVAHPFASITPLLNLQPYIESAFSLLDWQIADTAPISPRVPPAIPLLERYDHVFHLGYRDWPLPDVVRHTLATANRDPALDDAGLREADLALDQPWITIPPARRFPAIDIAFAWSDEHFELKYGLSQLLIQRRDRDQMGAGDGAWRHLKFQFCQGPNSRWQEAGVGAATWENQAAVYSSAKVVVGCCSALHVLAVACGTPVVLMEPSPARHNPVFYPFGKFGSRVSLVFGVDGGPTFDSRHVADITEAVLHRRT